MRLGWVAAVAALALLPAGSAWAAPILITDPDGGNAVLTDDPALPASDPMAATSTPDRRVVGEARTSEPHRPLDGKGRAHAHAAAGRSVPAAIRRLRKRDQITARQAASYRKDWSTSVRASRRMARAKASEMRAVLANARAIAASGKLSASRIPAVMLTVVRNRDWWSKGPSLRAGGRTRFRDSQLVWQYYPGQGLQIQWLGTFGRANALWSFGGKDDELDDLLTEARSLAASRAGGIAYEYQFRFGYGRPPWVSGLTQGTALTAFSRGALRLKQSRYFDDARAALGIFKRKPPTGVRVRTANGVHYLQYSYAPSQRVSNGFVQSLNGLHDFALLANDTAAWKLFASGERSLRSELPRFDTGAWTLYQRSPGTPGPESTLDYHKLLTQFLSGLCTRLTDDRERSARNPDRSSLAGRTGPRRYCNAATRFKDYLKQKPTLKITPRTLTQSRAGRVTVRVDKISDISMTVSQGGRTLAAASGRFAHGRHRLAVRPRGKARVRVRVSATDLAGNSASRSLLLRVRAKAGR